MTTQLFSEKNEGKKKKTQHVNRKKEEEKKKKRRRRKRWGQRSNDVGNNKAKISADAQEKSRQQHSEARCCGELTAKALQVEAQFHVAHTVE